MSAIKSRLGWTGALAALAVGSAVMIARVSPVDAAPAADKKPAASVKLTKPWSELASLSDEQKTKIHEIHVKALAQVSEIEKQEKADCMAVLTDAQKTELKDATAKDRKDAAIKKAGKAAGPATAPAK